MDESKKKFLINVLNAAVCCDGASNLDAWQTLNLTSEIIKEFAIDTDISCEEVLNIINTFLKGKI